VSRKLRRSVVLAVAAATTVGLIGAGSGVAASAPRAHPAVAHTPSLKVVISKGHFVLTGPKRFRAGRVAISLTAVGNERKIQVARFAKGFTFKDLVVDIIGFGSTVSNTTGMATPAGMKHLRDAIHHTLLLGGLDAQKGQTLHGTVMLAKPGKYTIYNDSGNVPTHPVTLTVIGPAAKRAIPHSTATVVAMTDRRFGGSKTLPAHGIIRFANHSTESPHFLDLQQVTPGTTRKDVLDALEGNSPPTIFLGGAANTDAVSPGQSQTLRLSLPKGTYAEMCFFPDPGAGMGIPHAFMGMIDIVQVK
jgi:hypothetical protein